MVYPSQTPLAGQKKKKKKKGEKKEEKKEKKRDWRLSNFDIIVETAWSIRHYCKDCPDYKTLW